MKSINSKWSTRVLVLAAIALTRGAGAQNAPTALNAEEFTAAMKEPHVCLVDMRAAAPFGEGHIAGFTNIGMRAGVADWLKKMLPAEGRPLVVLSDDKEAAQVANEFAKAEIAAPLRYLRGGMANWKGETAKLPQKSVSDLKKSLDGKENLLVLDVRSDEEWQAGHIGGAHHFVLGDLTKNTPKIAMNQPVAIICGSGYRSSIAASILKGRGFTTLFNISGGMGAWQAAGNETMKDK